MKRSNFFQIVVFFCLTSLLACTDPPQEDNSADYIIGRWEIQEASRNGRPTESLDQLYFEFFEDGTMNSNITGATQESKYVLEDGLIKQSESPMDANYNIEEISDSTLTMNSNISGQIFRFIFQKQQLEE